MIACCTFENIAAIIFFGICKAIAFSEAQSDITGEPADIGMSIGFLFIHNIAGLGAGIVMGLGAWLFKFIRGWRFEMELKAAYITCTAVSFIIASEFSTFTDSKFIACITFGYVCFRFWGNEKPMKEVGWVWFFIQPLLFGTVGASLLVKNI